MDQDVNDGAAQGILAQRYADKLGADGVDCRREIHENAERMAALIDALLSLSRVTRTELEPERVSLSELVAAAIAAMRAREPERAVEVALDAGLAAEIEVRLARTLVDNLLENAWKVIAARIEIGARDPGGDRVFFVRDNGAGFDMAFADKLFAPFQRLHTVGEFPGTGIGLATAQRIVLREQEDVLRTHANGASAYVRKPVDFAEFAAAVVTIGLFWLELNRAPPMPRIAS